MTLTVHEQLVRWRQRVFDQYEAETGIKVGGGKVKPNTFEAALMEKPEDVKSLTLGLASGNEISGECDDPHEYPGFLILKGKNGMQTVVGVEEIEYVTFASGLPPGQQDKPQPKKP